MGWKRTRSVLLLAVTLLGGLLLPACGDDVGGNPPPSILITVQPEQLGTVLPGCEPGELESWYEVAGSLVVTFLDESLSVLDGLPDTLIPALPPIGLRDAIAAQPAPECAVLATAIFVHAPDARRLPVLRRWDAHRDALRAEVQAAADAISTTVAGLPTPRASSLRTTCASNGPRKPPAHPKQRSANSRQS